MKSATSASEHDPAPSRPVRVKAPDFDLEGTLDSGQVFHWEAIEGAWFAGFIGDTAVRLRAQGDELEIEPAGAVGEVRRYFRLDEDHGAVLASFPSADEVLGRAVAFCPGLRLVRQRPWECLATFITSSLKQVAHIRQISLAVRRRWGRCEERWGLRLHAYPEPAVLFEAGEAALRETGMGYRAKALHDAARRVVDGSLDLEAAAGLPDEALREALCEVHGVGEKIANCTMLFGFGRMAAFPVDVWIRRVLEGLYGPERFGLDAKPAVVEAQLGEHFGRYGGYAQQYLFHYARKNLGRAGLVEVGSQGREKKERGR